jgi:hypothetical protein
MPTGTGATAGSALTAGHQPAAAIFLADGGAS